MNYLRGKDQQRIAMAREYEELQAFVTRVRNKICARILDRFDIDVRAQLPPSNSTIEAQLNGFEFGVFAKVVYNQNQICDADYSDFVADTLLHHLVAEFGKLILKRNDYEYSR